MNTIQVFDPALCCSSGVCGVEVDQKLVGFAADVDWARQNGALIGASTWRSNETREIEAMATRNARRDAFVPLLKDEPGGVDRLLPLAGSLPAQAST